MSFFDNNFTGENAAQSQFRRFFGDSTAVGALMIANIAVFVLSMLFPALYECLTLSFGALAAGYFWAPITYSFMHAGFLHILCNMLGLYFMGRPLETWLGWRKFLAVYFLGVLLGAAAWLALEAFIGDAVMLGASAGVMAVFAAFCLMYPPMPLTFLIFFIIPVRLMPITMLKIAAAFEVFGLLASLSGAAHSDVAYAAHLGGIAAGLVFVYLLRRGKIPTFGGVGEKFSKYIRKPKFHKRADQYTYKVNISADSPSEIDRILDKIEKSGFSSLTEEERQFLRRARDMRQ